MRDNKGIAKKHFEILYSFKFHAINIIGIDCHIGIVIQQLSILNWCRCVFSPYVPNGSTIDVLIKGRYIHTFLIGDINTLLWMSSPITHMIGDEWWVVRK